MLFQPLALGAILLFGFVLRLAGLSRNGFGNAYYSASVFSMSRNLHNFLYAAFDPAGVLAVDKPPVALWFQVLAVRLLGFQPLGVLLPQAIEGMLSVLILWHLVRRRFGVAAGLIAALLLAVTPIAVAVDRSSNTDSCLVLGLMVSAWALLAATERSSLPRLMLAMALVGVAFNVKMMAAWVVLPSFAATYWFGARLAWPARLAHLAAAGLVCLGVSLSWISMVQLTPAAERPYVDSSPLNSMFDLVVDHNAWQRFFPRPGVVAQLGNERVPAGPLRLADPRLASQVAWLAPLAVIGTIGIADVSLILWFGWLLTYAIVYSAAGGLFSPYYLVTLAPPLAALGGIACVRLWTRWPVVLLPIAITLTALWQMWLILPATEIATSVDGATAAESGRIWLAVAVMGGVTATVLGMMLAPRPREAKGAAIVALLTLMIAPLVWTGETAFALTQGARPVAALEQPTNARRRWDGAAPDLGGLAAFLRSRDTGSRFLAATANARQAAPLIIATGAPVIALGGYQGRVPVVTLPALEAMVQAGQLRFVLLETGRPGRGNRGPGGGRPERTDIIDWVHANGQPVDPALWHESDDVSPREPELFDLHPQPGR